MSTNHHSAKHIRLTSHPVEGGHGALPIRWGRADPRERGPVVGSTFTRSQRNVIGTHSGSYGVYRALAVAAGALLRDHRADLTDTMPADPLGPYAQWADPNSIVAMDPFGAIVVEVFKDEIAEGYDIRPTIAVTKAHIDMPEVRQATAAGRLHADGRILLANGSVVVTKAAIEPVWWLPGVAERFGVAEADLRRAQQGGVGLVVYSRKEGRALGEVTKFLVYNARKRQKGGDSADNYFLRTECVAGVQDMRFQELMPDVLHWLGIRRIHRLVSMSNLKYDAIVGSAIEVGERVKLPDELIPADARVEMDAKKAAGYYSDGEVSVAQQVAVMKGRDL